MMQSRDARKGDKMTVIADKQDMSRFARAHESGGVEWRTMPGPGGTIIVLERGIDYDVPRPGAK
jgi:hypothetical protein